MGNPLKFTLIVLFAVTTAAAQTPAGQTALGPNQLQTQIRRLPNGKPDLSGIGHALNTANWARDGQGGGPSLVLELGAIGATPPGLGVVEGGKIPYQEWAAKKKQENYKNRLKLDPELKCHLPGVPRATYLPYPFRIFFTYFVSDPRFDFRLLNASPNSDTKLCAEAVRRTGSRWKTRSNTDCVSGENSG